MSHWHLHSKIGPRSPDTLWVFISSVSFWCSFLQQERIYPSTNGSALGGVVPRLPRSAMWCTSVWNWRQIGPFQPLVLPTGMLPKVIPASQVRFSYWPPQCHKAPWPRPFLAPPFGARADRVATALALPVGWACCTLGGPCAAEREPGGAALRGQQPGISTTLAGGLGNPGNAWVVAHLLGILDIWHASSRGVVSLLTIWNRKMLKDANGNPTGSWRNPNKNYKMLDKSNFILRDILLIFGDLTIGIPDKICSKSTEETEASEGKLETLNKTQES